MIKELVLLKRFIVILAIIGIVLPSLALAGEERQPPKMPATGNDWTSFLKKIIEPFSRTMGIIWQEALEIWQRMADFFINLWNSQVQSKIDWIWEKVAGVFGKEIEKRKEEIPQELEKEKQELKDEAQEVGKSLWERLKNIIPGI